MSVALQAVYKSHRTTVDGGLSISFDVGEHMADAVNDIFRMRDVALLVVVMTEAEYYAKQQENSSNG